MKIFERRGKNSLNRYLSHYVSSIENGRLIEGRVVRDLCLFGIVCDTRRGGRGKDLQSIEPTRVKFSLLDGRKLI